MKPAFGIIAVLVTLVFWLPGCSSGNANDIKAALGQEFTLPVGQTAAINDREIVIKFESVVTDSRCPAGVQCIWAGEAKCQMQITSKTSTDNIVLTDSNEVDGYAQNKFSNYTAYFRLEPYPEAGKEIAGNDYRLLLKITR